MASEIPLLKLLKLHTKQPKNDRCALAIVTMEPPRMLCFERYQVSLVCFSPFPEVTMSDESKDRWMCRFMLTQWAAAIQQYGCMFSHGG